MAMGGAERDEVWAPAPPGTFHWASPSELPPLDLDLPDELWDSEQRSCFTESDATAAGNEPTSDRTAAAVLMPTPVRPSRSFAQLDAAALDAVLEMDGPPREAGTSARKMPARRRDGARWSLRPRSSF